MFDRMMKAQQLTDAGFYRTGVAWRVRLAFQAPNAVFDFAYHQRMRPNVVQILHD